MPQSALLPEIRTLKAYVPGLSIDGIREKYALGQVIKLASNENPLGASPLACEAAKRHAGFMFRYPQGGNPRLRAALARLHNVNAENIALGNGSDEIIDLIIRMLARSGEHNIVCFNPCFSIYPIQAQINGITALRVQVEADFSFNFGKLLANVNRATRIVFITSPDNPSGYCPARAEVLDFARALGKKNSATLLVIDEAYMDFAPAEKELSLLANGHWPENVAFLRTFSKSYGLAGMRVGYGVFPAWLANAFWSTRLPFSLNILAEETALAALEDSAFRQATLEAVKNGRNFLLRELEKLGCEVWPANANFLMFRLPSPLSAKECFNYLLGQGIIIRPLDSYGLPDNLRVSVGNKDENALFVKKLRAFASRKKA